MHTYGEATKANIVRRMLGPSAQSQTSLAKELGMSQTTLSRWRAAASARVGGMSKQPLPPPTSPCDRRPEDWSSEERLRVIVASSGLQNEALGELLRREWLHESTPREWRTAALEGISPRRPNRADQKRIAKLEKELARRDKALAETAALLVLKKTVRELWGDGDDDTPPRSDE